MVRASKAAPFVWHWSTLYPPARRAGDLVPVGRGGERRAIAPANPGLGGVPYVTPTPWAAIQYLGHARPRPDRHSQNAFRFVVEGEGVWTVVNGARLSDYDLDAASLLDGWTRRHVVAHVSYNAALCRLLE